MRVIVTFVLMLLGSAFGLFGQGALSMVREVPTIAALKALNVLSPHTTVTVRGYATLGDGGQGVFEYSAVSAVPEDGGIVIAPNAGGGRWVRRTSGRDYIARWWGPTKTNLTLQTAMNWVSSNGWGRVIADGGTWTVKSDDATRLLMQTGVTLSTADDSSIVCAEAPTNNWILIDFPLTAHDCGVGPARLVGWNLLPPGGDTNKSGLIFSLQDTVNVTIGGVQADNWYTQYADVGSGNQNLQMFDQDWQPGAMAHGAKGDGVTDDRRNLQSFAYFCERYKTEFYLRPTTNGYLIGGSPGETTSGGVYFTNGVPVKIRGDRTLIKQFYYNPDEGTLQRYSAAFQIYSHNCSIEGFDFTTVGAYPVTETNTAVTGFFIPIVSHMATNTIIKYNTFTVPTGKGFLFTGGSYGQILENTFNDCTGTYGNGHQPDWRFYEGVVPTSVGSFSPRGMVIKGNTFNRGTPYKTGLFLSACDDFLVADNYFVNMNTLSGPLLVYSGDEGTTDHLGTNVYKVSGKIINNFVSGTNFGTEGAIQIRLNTPTNYVPSTFNPDLMYSAITVDNNHIYGTGNAYNLIKANGTKIRGGDSRVTGILFYLLGNCDGIEIDGGHHETTGAGALGSAIVFGNAYLAPSNFKNVKLRNATFVSGVSSEYWMRNVIPIVTDSLTVENNDIYFFGTTIGGEAPMVFQFTQSTNFISFINNRFYVTNSMAGRPLGRLEGTNCDFTFVGNKTIPLSSSIPRGLQVSGRTVRYHGNDMRSFEVTKADELLVSDNLITYPDGAIPLEIAQVRLATVMGNRIYGQNTNSLQVATIHATNSIFIGNIVRGNSSGSIVTATTNGTMYSDRNVIENSGGSTVKPLATGSAVVREHNWMDDPLDVKSTVGSSTAVLSAHRAGGVSAFQVKLDGFFQAFHRDSLYFTTPDTATDPTGHAFFIRHADGTDEFAFGVQANTEGRFQVGTDTNAIDFYLSGLSTNKLLRLNENGVARAVTIGAGMTFDGTTLASTGGGGGTNQTPWFQDIDGGGFYLTNAAGITLRSTTGSAVSLVSTNTEGSFSTVTDGGGVSFDISDNTAVFQYKLAGVSLSSFGSAGINPNTANQALGTSLSPFSRLWLSTIGLNMAGISDRPGTGSPEGVESAVSGSTWRRTNGVAGAALYVKESGTGNTGWVPVPTQDVWVIPLSDPTSVIAAGTSKAYFRAPFALTLVSVRAYLFTAQSTGSLVTVDVNETGSSLLGTKITIDNAEEDSRTAIAAATITDTAIADGAKMTVDIDGVGDGTAKWLILELVTHR